MLFINENRKCGARFRCQLCQECPVGPSQADPTTCLHYVTTALYVLCDRRWGGKVFPFQLHISEEQIPSPDSCGKVARTARIRISRQDHLVYQIIYLLRVRQNKQNALLRSCSAVFRSRKFDAQPWKTVRSTQNNIKHTPLDENFNQKGATIYFSNLKNRYRNISLEILVALNLMLNFYP